MDIGKLMQPIGYLRESIAVLDRVLDDRVLLDRIEHLGRLSADAIRSGGKILFAGNGGSAADAQHLAGELVSRFLYDRPGIASIALTTDTSVITAIGNDYGYDKLFARQIEALGRAGDVFVGISTSGRSPNVLNGLKAAKRLGLSTVGFTGQTGGDMPDLCDLVIRAPSDSTPIIQQVHLVIGHLLCGMIEEAIHPKA